jgi:transposase
MQTVTTIGLDIAKSVFQVHGVDAAGQVLIRRKLKHRYVLAFFQKRIAVTVATDFAGCVHEALDFALGEIPASDCEAFSAW